MPTAKEIREGNEAEQMAARLKGTAYASLLDEHPLERIDTEAGVLCLQIGPIQVMAGEDPEKPVIRDAKTKRAMPGSGRYLRKSTTVVAPEKAYRQSTEYRERFAQLMPEGDVDEVGSDAWWMDRAVFLAMGSPTAVDCPHPELHTGGRGKLEGPLKHIVIQKPDPTIVNNLLKMRFGNAPSTINVNKKEEKLTLALEYRVHEVRLQGFSPDEATSRKELIQSFGYELDTPIEAEMVDATIVDS